MVGEGRGGREGGASSDGDTDLTVLTEAVEDRESLLEVRLMVGVLEGLNGDRLVSRSSVEVLIIILALSLVARARTLCTLAVAVVGGGATPDEEGFSAMSSWELDFTRAAAGCLLPIGLRPSVLDV